MTTVYPIGTKLSIPLPDLCTPLVRSGGKLGCMWEIGVRLKRARGERTLEDSARRGGVSNSYLSKLKRGEKTPNWELLARLAVYYEVSADEILGITPLAVPDDERAQAKEIAALLDGVAGDTRAEALAILRLMAEQDRQRQERAKLMSFFLDIVEAGGGPEAVDELIAALSAPGGPQVARARLLAWFRQRFPEEE